MKPTISIALITLGLTFPVPVMADKATFDLADLPMKPPKPTARIQQVDSLAKFLKRHGINKEKLKTFEPSNSPPVPTPERKYFMNQLERNLRQEALRWRSFGGKQYDWKGWKKSAGGSYTTTMRYSSSTYRTYKVAVTCKGLKVSHKDKGVWSRWKMPNAGEEQMLIELCSQIPGAPKATVRLAPPPKTCTGSRIKCATQL